MSKIGLSYFFSTALKPPISFDRGHNLGGLWNSNSTVEVCLRDFLESLYIDPVADGVGVACQVGLYAGTNEYVLVRPTGEILSFKLAGRDESMMLRKTWKRKVEKAWKRLVKG